MSHKKCRCHLHKSEEDQNMLGTVPPRSHGTYRTTTTDRIVSRGNEINEGTDANRCRCGKIHTPPKPIIITTVTHCESGVLSEKSECACDEKEQPKVTKRITRRTIHKLPPSEEGQEKKCSGSGDKQKESLHEKVTTKCVMEKVIPVTRSQGSSESRDKERSSTPPLKARLPQQTSRDGARGSVCCCPPPNETCPGGDNTSPETMRANNSATYRLKGRVKIRKEPEMSCCCPPQHQSACPQVADYPQERKSTLCQCSQQGEAYRQDRATRRVGECVRRKFSADDNQGQQEQYRAYGQGQSPQRLVGHAKKIVFADERGRQQHLRDIYGSVDSNRSPGRARRSLFTEEKQRQEDEDCYFTPSDEEQKKEKAVQKITRKAVTRTAKTPQIQQKQQNPDCPCPPESGTGGTMQRTTTKPVTRIFRRRQPSQPEIDSDCDCPRQKETSICPAAQADTYSPESEPGSDSTAETTESFFNEEVYCPEPEAGSHCIGEQAESYCPKEQAYSYRPGEYVYCPESAPQSYFPGEQAESYCPVVQEDAYYPESEAESYCPGEQAETLYPEAGDSCPESETGANCPASSAEAIEQDCYCSPAEYVYVTDEESTIAPEPVPHCPSPRLRQNYGRYGRNGGCYDISGGIYSGFWDDTEKYRPTPASPAPRSSQRYSKQGERPPRRYGRQGGDTVCLPCGEDNPGEPERDKRSRSILSRQRANLSPLRHGEKITPSPMQYSSWLEKKPKSKGQGFGAASTQLPGAANRTLNIQPPQDVPPRQRFHPGDPDASLTNLDISGICPENRTETGPIATSSPISLLHAMPDPYISYDPLTHQTKTWSSSRGRTSRRAAPVSDILHMSFHPSRIESNGRSQCSR